MAYNQQQGTNYFCCGNPWDDIFGASNNPAEAQQVPEQKAPTQDWNNPFGNTFEPYNQVDDARSTDGSLSHVRSVGGDARSVDSRRSADVRSAASRSHASTYSRSSNLDGKSLKDIEREDYARTRALKLHSALAQNDDTPEAPGASVLASTYMARKHEAKRTFDDPEVSAKTAAVNAAVRDLKELKAHQEEMRMTQTTRPKKELTPEDVRDPDTVPGMKCKMDVEKEEEAKVKAFQMISNGKYQFDENAGLAIFSTNRSRVTRNENSKIQAIV